MTRKIVRTDLASFILVFLKFAKKNHYCGVLSVLDGAFPHWDSVLGVLLGIIPALPVVAIVTNISYYRF